MKVIYFGMMIKVLSEDRVYEEAMETVFKFLEGGCSIS